MTTTMLKASALSALLLLAGCASAPPAPAPLKATQATLDNVEAISAAIKAYRKDKYGYNPPDGLADLVPGYLAAIPNDGAGPSGNNSVQRLYNGRGGWIYRSESGELAVNIPGQYDADTAWRFLWEAERPLKFQEAKP